MITLYERRSSRSTRMIPRRRVIPGRIKGCGGLDLLLLQAGDLRFEVGYVYLQLHTVRSRGDRCVRS